MSGVYHLNSLKHRLIPEELKERPQWVVWRWGSTNANGKRAKVPHQSTRDRVPAKTNDPSTWSSFKATFQAFLQSQKHNNPLSGIGFVFTKDDPFVGIDLDDCITGSTIQPWAQRVINAFDSYTEISPSGNGVKIFTKGTIPESAKKAGIEMYDSLRFFTVTTDHIFGTPNTATHNTEALDKLYQWIKPSQTRKPQQKTVAGMTTNRSLHIARWSEHRMQQLEEQLSHALEGNLHHMRVTAARTAGGIVAYGYISEDEAEERLYAARRPQSNHTKERKAICDGISYGIEKPLELPVFPTDQAIVIENGKGYCPNCGNRIRRSRYRYPYTEETAWFCPSCRHPMTWPAEAYTPPNTSTNNSSNGKHQAQGLSVGGYQNEY